MTRRTLLLATSVGVSLALAWARPAAGASDDKVFYQDTVVVSSSKPLFVSSPVLRFKVRLGPRQRVRIEVAIPSRNARLKTEPIADPDLHGRIVERRQAPS